MLQPRPQQGRVAAARAIVNRAPILLADEPTGNLDRTTGIQVLELLRDLNRSGQTVVMVTHDPQAAAYARRVVNILDGQIVGDAASASGLEPLHLAMSATPSRRPFAPAMGRHRPNTA